MENFKIEDNKYAYLEYSKIGKDGKCKDEIVNKTKR